MDVALERAELAAMRVQWSGLPGARLQPVGGLLAVAAEGPPWLTQVCGLGLEPDQDLDAALAAAPGALVTVVDGTASDRELVRCGYRRALRLLRMGAVPERGDPVEGVVAAGPEAAVDVAQVCRAGFGLDLPDWWTAPLGRPGWTQLLAVVASGPVATGGLHVSAGSGWIGAATTVPAARGRGHQAALLRARLHLAAEQGARRVAAKVEPGTASHRNLLRAGFVEAYGLTQWEPGGS